mgnify:CR=1 FL=1
MEEDNKYIKRQKIYKIIMLMILTAFVTSILTAIYIVKLDGNTQTTNNSGVSSILNVLTSDSNLTKSLKGIETIVKSKYLNESDIDETSAIDGAIEGYINSLGDEYAEYIPADKMKEYTEGIMGNFVGIGIYMVKNTEKDLVQVLSPIRESPAEKAGIKAGDLITKVNGVSYTADQMSEMANTIKGEEGSKVTIEVLRGEQILTFEVTREKVNTNPVYSEKLENDIVQKLDEEGYVVEDCDVKAHISSNDTGIELITIKIKEKKDNSNENDENQSNETMNIEEKIVNEIQKIQKVEINVSKNQDNSSDESTQSEQQNQNITKNDIKIVKQFLIKEYGVSEKCLRIS